MRRLTEARRKRSRQPEAMYIVNLDVSKSTAELGKLRQMYAQVWHKYVVTLVAFQTSITTPAYKNDTEKTSIIAMLRLDNSLYMRTLNLYNLRSKSTHKRPNVQLYRPTLYQRMCSAHQQAASPLSSSSHYAPSKALLTCATALTSLTISAQSYGKYA